MDRMPEVSVLIPAYNVEPYIKECLDSVLAQTLQNFEIICIDDASTDRTWEILQEYADSDDRIRLFRHEKNRGQSCGRNDALDQASGEYVYMLDADDMILPEMLEDLVGECREHNLDVVAFETYQFTDGDRSLTNAGIRTIQYGEAGVMDGRQALTYCMERESFSLSVPTFLMKRSYLEETGLRFVEGILHEDVGYILELIVRAGRIRFLHRVYFLRRIRAGSTMTSGFSARNIEGYLKSLYRSFELEPALKKELERDPSFALAFRRWQRDIFGRVLQIYREASEEIAGQTGGSVDEEIRRSFELLKISEQGSVPWDADLDERLSEGVYLCGTGQYTSRMIGVIGNRDLVIRGIITLKKDRKAFRGFPLLGEEDLAGLDRNIPVILSVSHYTRGEYEAFLTEHGFKDRILPSF